jgi:hypothetical protein
MPCNTVTTIETDVSKLNPERLKKVIEENYFRAEIVNGELKVYGTSTENNAQTKKRIMQKYTEATIREASKRFGWAIKGSATTKTNLTQLRLGR